MSIVVSPEINGTLIHYYVTCKREAWLYSRKISPTQDDENIAMGKALADLKDEDKFPFSHLHFDKISKERGHIVVTEYKKSLKNKLGAEMQLLFYIYLLKNSLKLKKVIGKVICKKTVILVDDSDENFQKIEKIIQELEELIKQEKPPKFAKIKLCDK